MLERRLDHGALLCFPVGEVFAWCEIRKAILKVAQTKDNNLILLAGCSSLGFGGTLYITSHWSPRQTRKTKLLHTWYDIKRVRLTFHGSERRSMLDVQDRFCYMIYEHMPGGTLTEHLGTGRQFTEGEVRVIVSRWAIRSDHVSYSRSTYSEHFLAFCCASFILFFTAY